jgi:hypothetical protein
MIRVQRKGRKRPWFFIYRTAGRGEASSISKYASTCDRLHARRYYELLVVYDRSLLNVKVPA